MAVSLARRRAAAHVAAQVLLAALLLATCSSQARADPMRRVVHVGEFYYELTETRATWAYTLLSLPSFRNVRGDLAVLSTEEGYQAAVELAACEQEPVWIHAVSNADSIPDTQIPDFFWAANGNLSFTRNGTLLLDYGAWNADNDFGDVGRRCLALSPQPDRRAVFEPQDCGTVSNQFGPQLKAIIQYHIPEDVDTGARLYRGTWYQLDMAPKPYYEYIRPSSQPLFAGRPGRLVSIEDVEENQFVSSMLPSNLTAAYIGLRYYTEGAWVSVTGSVASYDSFVSRDFGLSRGCAVMIGSGWYPTYCRYERIAILEFPPFAWQNPEVDFRTSHYLSVSERSFDRLSTFATAVGYEAGRSDPRSKIIGNVPTIESAEEAQFLFYWTCFPFWIDVTLEVMPEETEVSWSSNHPAYEMFYYDAVPRTDGDEIDSANRDEAYHEWISKPSDPSLRVVQTRKGWETADPASEQRVIVEFRRDYHREKPALFEMLDVDSYDQALKFVETASFGSYCARLAEVRTEDRNNFIGQFLMLHPRIWDTSGRVGLTFFPDKNQWEWFSGHRTYESVWLGNENGRAAPKNDSLPDGEKEYSNFVAGQPTTAIPQGCAVVFPLSNPANRWISDACSNRNFGYFVVEYFPSVPEPRSNYCELGLCTCTQSENTLQVVCARIDLRVVPIVPANTTSLQFRGNRVSSLYISDFSYMISLVELDASDNFVTYIEPGTFKDLSIEILYLGANGLTKVPALPPTIRELGMSYNHITELVSSTFENTPHLESANFNYNALQRVYLPDFHAILKTDTNNDYCDCFQFEMTLEVVCDPSTCDTSPENIPEPSTTADPALLQASSSSSSGANPVIIGAAVGGVGLLALIGLIVVLRRRSRHSAKSRMQDLELMVASRLTENSRSMFFAKYPGVVDDPRCFESDFSMLQRGSRDIELGKYVGQHARLAQISDNTTLSKLAVVAKHVGGDVDAQRNLLVEARLMAALQHPHIVHLMAYTPSTPVWIATAHCAHGDLRTFLRKSRPASTAPAAHLELSDLEQFSKDIVLGCHHLASHGIIHTQLCAENVYVTAELRAVIGHLGNAIAASRAEATPVTAEMRNQYYRWMAPELLRGSNNHFSPASDVFAVGMTLYEVMTYGKQPWGQLAAAEIYKELSTGAMLPRPLECPSALYTVITNMCKMHPQDRLSMGETLLAVVHGRVQRVGVALAARVETSQWELDPDRLEFLRNLQSEAWQNVKLYSLLPQDPDSDEEPCSVAAVLLPAVHEREDISEFRSELRSVLTLQHDNLLQLIGCVTRTTTPMVVFEHLPIGDLKSALQNKSDVLVEPMQLALDVAEGLQYLHSRCVIHRSLRAAACFVTNEGRVRIAGLRVTPRLHRENYVRNVSSAQNASRWLAPESLRKLEFSASSDMFSLGATLFEIFSGGRDPFDQFTVDELLQILRSRQSPPTLAVAGAVPDSVASFLLACCDPKPLARPTASAAMQFLKELLLGVDRWEFPPQNLTFVKTLGEGQFGAVEQMLAQDLPHPGTSMMVAVKTLKMKSSQASEEELDSAKKEFLAEMDLMKRLHHTNLTQLLGVCTKEWPYRIILSFEACGSLEDWLETPVGRQSSARERLFFCHQIACGVQALHTLGIIHRDLACRNCLMGSDGTVKVSDYGLSREMADKDYYRMATQRPMPLRWMSPETVLTLKFSPATDCWSFGVTMWEIFTGADVVPFDEVDDKQVLNILKNHDEEPLLVIPNCPTAIIAIQQQCFCPPDKRPSMLRVAQQTAPIHWDKLFASTTGPSGKQLMSVTAC
eukprot:m.63290 g.63290  ORF g.63290 m.63290 type:complete len:1790 (-) comp7448_c0_seq1:173-5542(-)